jgi:uncharacterized protein (DUF2344 family)
MHDKIFSSKNSVIDSYKNVFELPREVGSEVKKSQNGKEAKTVEKISSSNATIEKGKPVQIQSSSTKIPITISEKPKVQNTLQNPKLKETSSDDYEDEYKEEKEEDDIDLFEKKYKKDKRNQTDVTKLHQKPKLYMDSSEDYSEGEEEDQEDDTYDNNQTYTMQSTMKQLPMIEGKKKNT